MHCKRYLTTCTHGALISAISYQATYHPMDGRLLHSLCAFLQHGFTGRTHHQVSHPWRHVVKQGRRFDLLRLEVETARHSPCYSCYCKTIGLVGIDYSADRKPREIKSILQYKVHPMTRGYINLESVIYWCCFFLRKASVRTPQTRTPSCCRALFLQSPPDPRGICKKLRAVLQSSRYDACAVPF